MGARREMLTLSQTADLLDELQAKENRGRGVACVRSMVFLLRQGELGQAVAVANHEWDKIRNYPKIAAACKEQQLYPVEARPRTVMD
jgi:hypothetical protein